MNGPGRAAKAASRSFESLSFPGGGSRGVLGTTFTFDPEVWIYARITAQPDPDNAGASTGVGSAYSSVPCDGLGYSWVEVVPIACGEWEDAPEDERLSGENGTGELPASMPAFEAGGSVTVPVDDPEGTRVIVKLYRGYQHGGTDQDRPGQEWVFWYARSPASTGGDVELIRTYAGYLGTQDPPQEYATNGAGIYAYLGDIQDYALAGIVLPPDSGTMVWLIPYYQENIWGSLPNTTLEAGRAYPGKYTGFDFTGVLNDGGEGSEDISYTLPAYWFTMRGIAGICDDEGPVWSGLGVG
jgi:hypothetical protein